MKHRLICKVVKNGEKWTRYVVNSGNHPTSGSCHSTNFGPKNPIQMSKLTETQALERKIDFTSMAILTIGRVAILAK